MTVTHSVPLQIGFTPPATIKNVDAQYGKVTYNGVDYPTLKAGTYRVTAWNGIFSKTSDQNLPGPTSYEIGYAILRNGIIVTKHMNYTQVNSLKTPGNYNGINLGYELLVKVQDGDAILPLYGSKWVDPGYMFRLDMYWNTFRISPELMSTA